MFHVGLFRLPLSRLRHYPEGPHMGNTRAATWKKKIGANLSSTVEKRQQTQSPSIHTQWECRRQQEIMSLRYLIQRAISINNIYGDKGESQRGSFMRISEYKRSFLLMNGDKSRKNSNKNNGEPCTTAQLNVCVELSSLCQ